MKKLIVSSEFSSITRWHFQICLLSSCVCLRVLYTLVSPLVKLQQPVDVMCAAPLLPPPSQYLWVLPFPCTLLSQQPLQPQPQRRGPGHHSVKLNHKSCSGQRKWRGRGWMARLCHVISADEWSGPGGGSGWTLTRESVGPNGKVWFLNKKGLF